MRGSSAYYYQTLPSGYVYARGPYAPMALMGQDPGPAPPTPMTPEEDKALSDRIASGVTEAFKRITLSLVLVAVVTGGAFATGNWLAHRYVLPKK